jgi:hypothetical protein
MMVPTRINHTTFTPLISTTKIPYINPTSHIIIPTTLLHQFLKSFQSIFILPKFIINGSTIMTKPSG